MRLLRSSILFSLGTVLSRITGLLRDMILASSFGSSVFMDAFFVAFRIPNLFREMLAEGALAGAFTKVYVSLSEEDGEEASQFLVDSLFWITVLGTLLCLLGILLAPNIVELMTAFGGAAHDEELKRQATGLTRILFPFLGIMMIGSVAMGALHHFGRFFLSAFAPVNFNLGYIIGILAVGPVFYNFFGETIGFLKTDSRVTGVAVGVIIGGLGQVSFYLVGLWKKALSKIKCRPNMHLTVHMKKLMVIMLPAALAASTGPINLVINTNFATSLEAGSVTWLNYAFRLFQLPVGVFGVAMSVAILPALTRSIVKTQGVNDETSETLQHSVGLTMWFIIPCLIFLVSSSEEVISLLFGRGKFGDLDVAQTSLALKAYSFGLIGYSLIKVFTSFYFAVERTSYVLKIAVFCVTANLFLNYYFLKVLGYNHEGLAATSAIVLSLNALLLFLGVFVSGVRFNLSKTLVSSVKFAILALIAIVFMSSLPDGISLGAGVLIDKVAVVLVKLCCVFVPFLIGFLILGKQSKATTSV